MGSSASVPRALLGQLLLGLVSLLVLDAMLSLGLAVIFRLLIVQLRPRRFVHAGRWPGWAWVTFGLNYWAMR